MLAWRWRQRSTSVRLLVAVLGIVASLVLRLHHNRLPLGDKVTLGAIWEHSGDVFKVRRRHVYCVRRLAAFREDIVRQNIVLIS